MLAFGIATVGLIGGYGGEVTKAADINDFVIIQFNLKTGETYLLKMVDYDSKTGDYTVDFPCLGPYMLTWKA